MCSLRLLKCLLINSIFNSLRYIITELLPNLLLVYCIHGVINFIIMLVLWFTISNHNRISVFILHNISHIKSSMMCKPIINHQKLLSFSRSTGFFHFLNYFFACIFNCIRIKINSKLVSIMKIHYHSHEVIIRIFARSNFIYCMTCQHQHFSKDSQSIFAFFPIREKERKLDSQNVCMLFPLIKICLI